MDRFVGTCTVEINPIARALFLFHSGQRPSPTAGAVRGPGVCKILQVRCAISGADFIEGQSLP
jgi:hypothetical protein